MKSFRVITTFLIAVDICKGESIRSIALRRLEELEPITATIEGGYKDLLPEADVDYICDEKQLRFLTIGRSAANEKGLDFSKQAYPFLLCGGDVIARDDLLPKDVAGCLQSLLQDRIYDVIVLDFFEVADQGLNLLASRLRNKFPDATIVNLKPYFPGWTGFQSRYGWVGIEEWAKKEVEAYTEAIADNIENLSTMSLNVLDKLKDTSRPWEMANFNKQQSAYDQTTRDYSLWALYKDTPKDFQTKDSNEIKDRIWRRAHLYLDWFTYNSDGHKDIARGVLSIAKMADATKSDLVNVWDNDAVTCSSSN